MQTVSRRPAPFPEDQVLRFGAALVGFVLTTSASLAADLAREHMLALGAVCGAGPNPHCGWCLGAASLVLAGLAAFAVALRGPRYFGRSGLLQIKAGHGQA